MCVIFLVKTTMSLCKNKVCGFCTRSTEGESTFVHENMSLCQGPVRLASSSQHFYAKHLQVQAFLSRHKNYQHEPVGPAGQEDSTFQAVISPEGSILTFPHLHGVGDGSFAARLRRVS